MIIDWTSNVNTAGRADPHIYVGLGVIGLSIVSTQVLFDYTELAYLVTMELNKSLHTMELANPFISMELNRSEFNRLA